MGFLPKLILLVLKRLLEFNNFSWESFHQMVSKQLNSLIEVNQATMEVSAHKGVVWHTFHLVFQHRCLQEVFAQVGGISTHFKLRGIRKIY